MERALCRVSDLADGKSRGLDPLNEGCDTMFVICRGEDVYAYRNACPHVPMAKMAWRKDEYLNADGSLIRCSAHGALFSIATGECIAGACVGAWLTPVNTVIREGYLWLAGDFAPRRQSRPRSGQQDTAAAMDEGRARP
ncbi:nitrite reductase/ring-hydroxylating ferredoxin subunit [Sphingobium sp. OAS761]|uniref:Rieske (2Fe-2S) protein n=1 Tax=Sphingobium sp. OAS761 TaxID=2817901 RepID=UPI00209DC210|nr:nitrite reductase/ring-hydroxylating ferredoxin subunit [Sphingobium sp. OAS761]